jgi:hypothetical protein
VAAFEGKAPVVLHALVAHVRETEGGRFGFGLSLQERRVQSFYAWYQLIARLQQTAPADAIKRTTTRAPLMGEVRVDVDLSLTVVCAMGDISKGGMRLFGDAHLPAESALTVHFFLPEQAVAQRATARVRWMQRQAPGRHVYGLEFEKVGAPVATAISRYVDEVRAYA